MRKIPQLGTTRYGKERTGLRFRQSAVCVCRERQTGQVGQTAFPHRTRDCARQKVAEGWQAQITRTCKAFYDHMRIWLSILPPSPIWCMKLSMASPPPRGTITCSGTGVLVLGIEQFPNTRSCPSACFVYGPDTSVFASPIWTVPR